jgi:CheY-like chemotaxis protein
VIDTGIGISNEYIQKLGTPFNSYDTHGINGKGIGLGLAIAKEIIGKLGPKAHLHISSKLGQGSKFAFRIYRSLVLKENTGAQKIKLMIKPLSKKEFTFEKITLKHQMTDLSNDIEFSEDNRMEPMGRIDEEFSEVDLTDLQDESHISMNFDSEAIDEKILKNCEEKDMFSPLTIKKFFDKRIKKQTMLQLNKNSSPKKETRNQSAQKKLINLLSERTNPLKILIVDDNLFNILIMEKYLKKLLDKTDNVKIINEFAHNGEIAVEKFKISNGINAPSPFSVIIMDCEMPIMNGFEASTLIGKLIEEEKFKKCEIVAYSALNLDSEVYKCTEHGMKYFLCKPCTENELFKILYKCLKLVEAGETIQIMKQEKIVNEE